MVIPVADPPEAPQRDETTVAALCAELRAGRREALDQLLPLVYHELRRIAHRELQARPTDTLSTTALVHEAYLKLVRYGGDADWRDRAHFLSVAAIGMRQILVDLARRRSSEKRGGSRKRVDFEEGLIGTLEDRSGSLLDLDEALTDLAAVDERLARVVECRFFGGMTEQETAAALGVTERTVRRDWTKARALLYQALGG